MLLFLQKSWSGIQKTEKNSRTIKSTAHRHKCRGGTFFPQERVVMGIQIIPVQHLWEEVSFLVLRNVF